MANKTDSTSDHLGLSSFRAPMMSKARRRRSIGTTPLMHDHHSSNARSVHFEETSDLDSDLDSSTTGQCTPRTPDCSFEERLSASSPSHDHHTSQAQDSPLDTDSYPDSVESCQQWPPQTPGCSFEESLPANSPARDHGTSQTQDPPRDKNPPSHSSENCSQWPPIGLEKRSMLTPQDAEMFICKGITLVEGVISWAPHTSSRHIRYNCTVSIGDGKTIRGSYSKDERFKDCMAIALNTAVECTSPWEVLERPVVALPFGPQPSTITLDHWVNLGCFQIEAGDSKDLISRVQPRKMEFYDILNRLDLLQHDEIDEDATLREHYLYSVLVHDLDKKVENYEMDIEKEIGTLINVLNLPIWFDFTKAETQLIVTYYENQDLEAASFFFQQLLLSMELFLRIREEIYDEEQKVRILARLPPRVAWTVAMAQIWMSKVVIERVEEGNSALPFRVWVIDTEVQKAKLINFGYLLKWPNTAAVALVLEKTGNDVMTAEDTHPAVMTYLSGVVFPGISASWLMMQCLVDCDRDARETLQGVNTLQPNFGFQYRGATYWYWRCIIGKVLGAAKGVFQAAGWVGPCHHTDDLERTQAILVRQVHTSLPLGQRQVKSIAVRSDPLGPVDDSYPVGEYELALPTTMSDVADTIRIQKLAFKVFQSPNDKTSEDLTTYRSAVIFAINGHSTPIPLAYDVSFLSTAPCSLGPHALFYDYEYLSVRIDGLLQLNLQGLFDDKKRSYSRSVDSQKAIVIEAFGVPDNQVLARSWCSQHGFSAVVADINDTCMACSIRQAYALCVSVVILTCGLGNEDVEAVDRYPEICKHRDSKRSALED